MTFSILLLYAFDYTTYLFQMETSNALKPMDISQDNLFLPKGMTEAELPGKTVKVWFDGTAEYLEPESSVPISLGEVYRIELSEEIR